MIGSCAAVHTCVSKSLIKPYLPLESSYRSMSSQLKLGATSLTAIKCKRNSRRLQLAQSRRSSSIEGSGGSGRIALDLLSRHKISTKLSIVSASCSEMTSLRVSLGVYFFNSAKSSCKSIHRKMSRLQSNARDIRRTSSDSSKTGRTASMIIKSGGSSLR